jgi:hypothetical protein
MNDFLLMEVGETCQDLCYHHLDLVLGEGSFLSGHDIS